MCGLNFVYNMEDAVAVVGRMNSRLSHRGIRSSVQTVDTPGRIAIGHVRLPIQGLSEKYDQPRSMTIEGEEGKVNRFMGAFVGEVFNFHDFTPEAENDFEALFAVLLSGFRDGFQSLNSLDGFWSAILVSVDTREVYFCTDYLGQKPLYIRWFGENSYAVSSEVFPLLELGPVTPDEVFFSEVAKWGYAPNDRTPFREIKKMPAGMVFRFASRGQHVLYQELPWVSYPQEKITDEKALTKLLRDAVSQAVKNRLISDVPVALVVSGGLDSTIVYNLAQLHGWRGDVFHFQDEYGTDDLFFNQLPVAEGVRIHQMNLDELNQIEPLHITATPVDLGSVHPQVVLARGISSQKIQVALTGDGADELFGGYRRAKEYDSQGSDIFDELVHYHNPRLDSIMMRETVELRTPFLARPVLDLALQVPYALRTEKQILKKAFSDLVPLPILSRSKVPLRSREIMLDAQKVRLLRIELFRKEFFA